jgi:hypothetical protein
MNANTLKSLDKILAQMERRARRPTRRFSMAPIVLAVGLVLGEQLLVRFVPMVWETFLPGGLIQANQFREWPGLVWRMAVFCHTYERAVFVAIAAVALVGLTVCSRSWFCRLLARLAAFGVIVLDAGIVVVTMLASYQVTVANSGIPGL